MLVSRLLTATLVQFIKELRRTGKGERISYTSDRNSERKTWSTICTYSLATTYSNLLFSRLVGIRNLGELERAKDYHILAIEIEKEKLGPQHVRLATKYSNLGIVYQDLGDLERAKEYHILAMEIEKEKLGPQHVRLATTYSNLGIVVSGLSENLEMFVSRLLKNIIYLAMGERNHILAIERKTWSTTCSSLATTYKFEIVYQPWYSILAKIQDLGELEVQGERISYTSDGN